MSNVYLVYQKRKVSCDENYDHDGFLFSLDGEEIGVDLNTLQLIDEMKKYDDDVYENILNFIKVELDLDFELDKDTLNDEYFNEIWSYINEKVGWQIDKFCYQEMSFVREVHRTEESVIKAVDYYNKDGKDNHYYARYHLLGEE